jgi:hypothetical protein
MGAQVTPLAGARADDTAPEPVAPRRAGAAARTAGPGPFVPLLLATAALCLWAAGATWQLLEARGALVQTHQSQQETVDNAGRLRASLDTLAADTQRLADTGNPQAALLVSELKKRGITINAAATPAATPPAADAAGKR